MPVEAPDRTEQTDDLSESDREAIAAMNGSGEGRSIEDMAGDAKEDEEGQTLLDFGDHVNLSVKGKRPTDSEIKIKAVSRDIKGQLGDSGDDEIVYVLVACRLDKLEIVTKRDGDGRVASRTRRHVMTPISMNKVVPDEATEIIERDKTESAA